jgi:hypothetical protein
MGHKWDGFPFVGLTQGWANADTQALPGRRTLDRILTDT